MGASPRTRRVVLLGAGMGLGLILLEAGPPRGFWGGVTALVSLVPVALAYGLGGPLAAALAAGVGMIGAAVLQGGGAAVVVALKYALPGAVLGLGLTRRLPLAVTVLLVSLASLSGVAGLVWALAPTGVSPLAFLDRQIAAHVTALGEWPARFGGRAGESGWATEAARVVVATMQVAGPGMIALGVFLAALVNYLVARIWLRGAGLRPFAEEAVPDHFVWGVVGAGLLLVSRQPRLEAVGVNCLLVLVPLYAIQGLAVFRHFFLRVQVPRLLQIVSFGLFAMQPLLLVAVACVGLSDLWIDFRKIRRAPTAA